MLKHIVDSMYDDVPALFVNTGLEYPEIQSFVRDIKNGKFDCFNSDVEIVRPEMRFDEVIKKYGYPAVSKEVSDTISGAKNSIEKGVYSHRLCKLGVQRNEYGGLEDDGKYDYERTLHKSMYSQKQWRFLLDADFDVSSYCCDVMKKRPAKNYEKKTGRKAIIGTMAWESQNRRTAWIRHGCNSFEGKRQTSQPLSFWTEQDILHYIKKYNVPYCPVYGDIVTHDADGNTYDMPNDYLDALSESVPEFETTGCSRTGCVFCTFGCHREPSPNRFQRLKETHPRQYEYCINGGEYITEGFCQNGSGDWVQFVFEDDDGNPLTPEEIENFIEECKDNPHFRFERKWQPSKEGLGLGKVLDYIGVDYK